MTKIIISETQFNQLTKKLMIEAVGVPEYILDSGEKLFDLVANFLKSIDEKDDNYKMASKTELLIGDRVFDTVMIIVQVNELEGYDGEVVIASAGLGNSFRFDNAILMQVNEINNEIDLHINFIVPEEWEVEDLYNVYIKDKIHTTSIMSHELKHKYDRQKKEVELVGDTSDYQAYSSSGLRFGVPVLDEFMRFSYYIQEVENLVRPTELASRMSQKNIKREEFYDFITNDEIYQELKKIKDFSFNYLITTLKDEMEYVDSLIEHAGGDPESMNDAEKIKAVLELVYMNLVNAKIQKFDDYIYDMFEKTASLFGQLMGGNMPFGPQKNEDKEKVRRKYINHVIKYQNREIDFFKDECERFNYVATKLIKKIAKVFALIPEGRNRNISEEKCIIEWDLYHEMMEKKYGKRKIDTEYKYLRKK